MEKEVLRKCIGCNKLQNRENMLKITKINNTNEIIINPNSKTFGRSAYLCYNNSCIKEAVKKNKLDKALKTKVSEEIKEKIKVEENLLMV